MNRISKFTTQDKNNLLSKTFYVLPDNPSDKQFSASQIKKKGYEGYVVLFEFINDLIDLINDNIDLNALDLSNINSSISNLQDYFSSGSAKKAIADKDGNDIALTYETKSDATTKFNTNKGEIDKIKDGTTSARKAQEDASGNVIKSSYAGSLGHSFGVSGTQLTFKISLYARDGTMLDEETQVFGSATSSSAGLMSASDKAEVDANPTAHTTLQGNIDASGHSLEITGGQSTDYVYTVKLKDANGNTISTETFDLPLETVVVGGSYNSSTKKVILTLDSGSTIEFSVADLISGLVSQSDFDVVSATVTALDSGTNKAVKQNDVGIVGGYLATIKKGGVDYAVAQQVSVTTIPKVVQSTTDLPESNDGYLYVVLDNGYLYHWSNGAWTQGYAFTSDLFTITEVDGIEED